MFIGRTIELQLLEYAYKSVKNELVILYGRRRIGKSALIAQFIQGKPDVFAFEALEHETTAHHLRHFTRCLGRHIAEPLLENIEFKDWDQAFDYFTRNALSKKIKGNKYIIFFDELQWMAAGKSALVSLLKFYWDNHWKHYHVMLILCGSISSFMLKNVVRSKALYGRATLELNLKGLLPHEAHAMFRNKCSLEDVLKYLLIFGGVPKYLEEIDLHNSFNQNINRLCFSKNSSMINEPDKIFHSQFRRPETYLKIIKLLNNKLCTVKDIGLKTDIQSGGGLKSYIDNLVNADLIMPYIPFNKDESSRLARYVVSDEFLHFYFKYIQSRIRSINLSRSMKIFENITLGGFEAWLGFAFERFCHKHAGILSEIMDFADEVLSVGPFFQRKDEQFQIDLVYKRTDKVVMLCEIKHINKEITTAVIPSVERKSDLLKIPRGFTLQKALISLYGPDKPLAQSRYFDRIVTLRDIFHLTP